MEWVGRWVGSGTGGKMVMNLHNDNDMIVARYMGGSSGYWRIWFTDPRIDIKEELTRMTDMTEDEVQTYIKNKYLLLRGG